MKSNLVLIDGSNFYHYAKRMSPRTHLTDFDYRGFVEEITLSDVNVVRYCVGEVKRDKNDLRTQKLYANQQSLFYNLKKQEIEICKGYLLRYKLSYHEKGVDVRIALDILKGALKNEYDKCYLFSSDTDLLPAIFEAKQAGKEIVYIGFKNNPSRAMMKNCSRYYLVEKETLKKYRRANFLISSK